MADYPQSVVNAKNCWVQLSIDVPELDANKISPFQASIFEFYDSLGFARTASIILWFQLEFRGSEIWFYLELLKF